MHVKKKKKQTKKAYFNAKSNQCTVVCNLWFKEIYNNGKVEGLKEHKSPGKAVYTHIWPSDIYLGDTLYNRVFQLQWLGTLVSKYVFFKNVSVLLGYTLFMLLYV